ncbi:hypothetical protein SAY87_005298 [Trapa incisa]|uniref:Uncharacterized protein n=1 Tax=Trapa incisa TaxID=236973 RepID=A0AAN7KC65_9MYRT|nr:hypothetical protein SAY87_005298 [Trapa incisa]
MTKHRPNWFPYDNNGGSCLAIAGADYCEISVDTRVSTCYNFLTREYSNITKLADKCVMASNGFQADVKALQKLLAASYLDGVTPLSESEAVDLVNTVFASANERNIYTLRFNIAVEMVLWYNLYKFMRQSYVGGMFTVGQSTCRNSYSAIE